MLRTGAASTLGVAQSLLKEAKKKKAGKFQGTEKKREKSSASETDTLGENETNKDGTQWA